MFPKVWNLGEIFDFCSAIQALWLYFLTQNLAFWCSFMAHWTAFQLRVAFPEG